VKNLLRQGMQRKAGMARARQSGAVMPSTKSGEMRLTSRLPQMEQWALSKLARGVARERKRLAQREQRQGTLPKKLAQKSSKLRRRERRQSGELHTGQTIRPGRFLSDWDSGYARGNRAGKQAGSRLADSKSGLGVSYH